MMSELPKKELGNAAIGGVDRPEEGAEIRREHNPSLEILEVMRAEYAENLLAKKVLEGKIPLTWYKPLQEVLAKLDESFDIKERIGVLNKFKEIGAISPEIYDTLASAMLMDERDSADLMALFAKKGAEKFGASAGGKEDQRIAVQKFQERVARGMVAETEKLMQKYGSEIPQNELDKLRGQIGSLDRTLFNNLRSYIGGLALEVAGEAESRDGEKVPPILKRIREAVRIIFGRDQADLLESTTDLYAFLSLGHREGKNEKPALSSYFSGRPLMNTRNIFDIAKQSRDVLSRRGKDLSREDAGVVRDHLQKLEDFLLKAAHPDVKKEVTRARFDERKRAISEIKVRHILDINRVAEERFTSENIEAGLKEDLKEVEAGLRDAVKELVSSGPLDAEELVEQILHWSAVGQSLREEIKTLEEDSGQKIAAGSPEATKIVPFSKEAFEEKLREEDKKLAGAASDEAKEKLKSLKDLMDAKKYPFPERLMRSALAGIISFEEFEGFRRFNEAYASALELEAKEFGAYAIDLKDMDSSPLSQKQKEKLEENVAAALTNAALLYNRVRFMRGEINWQEYHELNKTLGTEDKYF